MRIPSLETFKTCLDAVLCSLLWVTLVRQGVGLGDPQRSLPTPNILWFCDSVITEARDFSLCGCWMLKCLLRTSLFQVLNFILKFVRRKSAVSSFQDAMKLVYWLLCDSFVELNRINCFLAKFHLHRWNSWTFVVCVWITGGILKILSHVFRT